ncbi:MAG: hypothetical protein CMF51_05645 [Legionellales bacterium]|nr:hypothetical protein [Legionellales bacterium]
MVIVHFLHVLVGIAVAGHIFYRMHVIWEIIREDKSSLIVFGPHLLAVQHGQVIAHVLSRREVDNDSIRILVELDRVEWVDFAFHQGEQFCWPVEEGPWHGFPHAQPNFNQFNYAAWMHPIGAENAIWCVQVGDNVSQW